MEMAPRATLPQGLSPLPRAHGAAEGSAPPPLGFIPPEKVLTSLREIPLVPLHRVNGMTHRDGSPRFGNVVGAFVRKESSRPHIPGEPQPWDHVISEVEVMATSSDGTVRRYPPIPDADGAHLEVLRKGSIRDVPAVHVKERIGGFELTPDRKGAAFMVDRRPESPIQLGAFQGHLLPDGKVLVLQPDRYQGGLACALMLLLDQGRIRPEDADRLETAPHHKGGTLESITRTLRAVAGVEPLVVPHEANFHRIGLRGMNRKALWRDMAGKIGTMGPAILLREGNNYVMLDKVREEKGKHLITIRDPFHGTCVEFKDTHDFFKGLDHSEGKSDITAIFLPRP